MRASRGNMDRSSAFRPTVGDALREGRLKLSATGTDTPGLDAEVLIRHALGTDRTGLFATLREPIEPQTLTEFRRLLASRASGTPVAYLTGEREFMGHAFLVTPGVLIPRPETEILVEWAILWLRSRERATVIDVGTGSGAIALSLAMAMGSDWPGAIIATDVSPEALQIAQANRDRFGLQNRVELRQSSLLEAVPQPVDLLLANLPYLHPEQIAANPALAAEPRLALDGGSDGLDLIRALLHDAPRVVAPGGAVGLEIDPSQSTAVAALARCTFPGSEIAVLKDLAGHDRHVTIQTSQQAIHARELPHRSATMRRVRKATDRQKASGGEEPGRVEFIDLETAPEELLRQLGKDERLIPYGGANFGMPLDLIDPPQCRTVPNDLFFVRSNGPIPVVEAEQWRLDVFGLVDWPHSLSLSDLNQFTDRSQEAFLECAGNSRTRFDPIPPGTPWRNDAIGNAVWEGVALADVLSRAGVLDGAVDVVTQGADFPEMRRGLPLSVALDPEVLIVTRMNGEPLPVAHGGPARLFVPGWAGIASTKWLIGIEVSDRPFDGFWNSDNYVFWDEFGTPLRPVAEMPPKSIIVAPGDGETIPSGAVTIAGWAWSGYGAIQLVEVSLDGGLSWRETTLHAGERRGWRRWEMSWQAAPGLHRILARATDERRLRQPATAPWNAKGYQMNAIHAIAVRVES